MAKSISTQPRLHAISMRRITSRTATRSTVQSANLSTTSRKTSLCRWSSMSLAARSSTSPSSGLTLRTSPFSTWATSIRTLRSATKSRSRQTLEHQYLHLLSSTGCSQEGNMILSSLETPWISSLVLSVVLLVLSGEVSASSWEDMKLSSSRTHWLERFIPLRRKEGKIRMMKKVTLATQMMVLQRLRMKRKR